MPNTKAQAIQDKLYKAYGIVSQTLGEMHEIYRSEQLDNPLNTVNYIDDVYASFSQNSSYSSPLGEGVSTWLAWLDGSYGIQEGDFLQDPETGLTYFIATAQSHLPIQAIRTPDRIKTTRTGYSDSGSGFGPGEQIIAENVPCWIEAGGSSGSNPGYIPASTYSEEVVPTVKIYCSDPANEISLSDVITDQNGYRYQVNTIDRNELATVISAAASEAV